VVACGNARQDLLEDNSGVKLLMATQLIGWAAAAVLLATIGRQVYSQWRDGTSQGVSKWLFVGQISASSGFIAYSWLLANWVFLVTNALILLTALFGQWVYLRNKRRSAANPPSKVADLS
jgi:MtN3 and saliva related transmembrane protein